MNMEYPSNKKNSFNKKVPLTEFDHTFSEHFVVGLETSNQSHFASSDIFPMRRPYLITGTSIGLLHTSKRKKGKEI